MQVSINILKYRHTFWIMGLVIAAFFFLTTALPSSPLLLSDEHTKTDLIHQLLGCNQNYVGHKHWLNRQLTVLTMENWSINTCITEDWRGNQHKIPLSLSLAFLFRAENFLFDFLKRNLQIVLGSSDSAIFNYKHKPQNNMRNFSYSASCVWEWDVYCTESEMAFLLLLLTFHA